MNQQDSIRPRRRSRAEADALVAEYEASGLSRKEFCHERGLSLNTLNRYCARRRVSAERSGAGAWVEVEVRDASRMDEHAGELWLHLACGRCIEVRRHFDPGALARLLRVLERA